MQSQLESIFDDAENRYLQPDELKVISQYVESLPERLEVYQKLRDQEVDIVQWAADQLQAALPQEKPEYLERSVKNVLLMLRCCATAMLLNDEKFVRERYISWVSEASKVYGTQTIDSTLYQFLNQRLTQTLGTKAMSLLQPMLMLAQNATAAQGAKTSVSVGR